MNVPLPDGLDFSHIYRNEGEMENKGLEFSLNTRNMEQKDFSWTTDLIFHSTEIR